MDEKNKYSKNLVHLSRLALSGRRQDILLFLRRMVRQYQNSEPEISKELNKLLKEAPSISSPTRSANTPNIPVDSDTRLQLVRFENIPHLEINPVWDSEVQKKLNQIITERKMEKELTRGGLNPTRSALFTGAPGVGKSLAAKWLANELKLPLLTLDLSAVMSSFLGRTGTNIRNVLDYAKSIDCILFLDELDAIAKKRADITEVGELKRLVTVILQEIDDWPPTGLLIAATNHSDLLDPAVWRRFDLNINFPMPNKNQVLYAVKLFLGKSSTKLNSWTKILQLIFLGKSYSDIERSILSIRREAIITKKTLEDILPEYINHHMDMLSHQDKVKIAELLMQSGLSQRQSSDLTGVSRDTIRKFVSEKEDKN